MRYGNADALFNYEMLIRSAMRRWGWAKLGRGQHLETHMRNIMYQFEDEKNRQAVWEELQVALGSQAVEIAATSPPTPRGPPATTVVITNLLGRNRPTEEASLVGPQKVGSTLSC